MSKVKLDKKHQIVGYIIFLPLFIILLLFYFLDSTFKIESGKLLKDSLNLQKEFYFNSFINEQKEYLKEYKKGVSLTYNFLLSRSKNELKTNVDLESDDIKNLYKILKKKYTKKEILEIIKNMLINKRFLNGYGYYFMYDTDYNVILIPTVPESKWKNFSHFKDVNGKRVMFETINGSKKFGSFWIDYYFKNPKSGKIEEKIGYTKYIKSLDIILGSGLYISQLETKYIKFLKNRFKNHKKLTLFLNDKFLVGKNINLDNYIKKEGYYISKDSKYLLVMDTIKKSNLKFYLTSDLSKLEKGSQIFTDKYKKILETYNFKIFKVILKVVILSLILSIILAIFIIRLFNKYINKIDELNVELKKEVKETTHKLEETTKLYETVFDLSPTPMTILDENFSYLKMNKDYFKKIILNNPNFDENIDYKYRKIGSFSLEDNFSVADKLISEFLNKDKIDKMEVELIYPNLKPQIFLISGKKIELSNQIYYILVGEDVTEYKNLLNRYETLNIELEKRVKLEIQKNREQQDIMLMQSRFATMGEMIGMIAHQWRQPLNVIALIGVNIELTLELEGSISNEVLKKQMNKLASTVKHMSQTIDDFKNMLTKENKSQEVFMKELVSKVLDLIEPQMKVHSIVIDVSYCKEDIKVYLNDSEFKQVLLNIINNSKDEFISKNVENPKIEFRCTKVIKDIEYLSLSIEDNAGGIPNDIIDKVFDPYFSTKSKNGTGIGLYMSKMIVEKQQGEIYVENIENGARFTILLPIYKENNSDKKVER